MANELRLLVWSAVVLVDLTHAFCWKLIEKLQKGASLFLIVPNVTKNLHTAHNFPGVVTATKDTNSA